MTRSDLWEYRLTTLGILLVVAILVFAGVFSYGSQEVGVVGMFVCFCCWGVLSFFWDSLS